MAKENQKKVVPVRKISPENMMRPNGETPESGLNKIQGRYCTPGVPCDPREHFEKIEKCGICKRLF